MPSQIDPFFTCFPCEQYWKFIIDKNRWALNNPLIFDQEDSPGYLQWMSLALWTMLMTVEEPLTTDYIQGIHDLAYHDRASNTRLVYAPQGISGLVKGSFNEAGFSELVDKIRNQGIRLSIIFKKDPAGKKTEEFKLDPSKTDQQLYSELLKKIDSVEAGLQRNTSISDILEVSQRYIDRYNQEIQDAAQDNNKKLIAIVRFIQDMHQYHPFVDGNGRTFVFLLLNKLLLQNNLSPAMVASPGRFTGWSLDSLVNEVKEGQKTFQALCTSSPNQQSLTDYLSQTFHLTEDNKEKALATVNVQAFLDRNPSRLVTSYFYSEEKDVQLSRIRDENVINRIIKDNSDIEKLSSECQMKSRDLLPLCAHLANFPMVKRIIKVDKDQSRLGVYKSAFVMAYMISGLRFGDFKQSIEKLNLSSDDIYELLIEEDNTIYELIKGKKISNEKKPFFNYLLFFREKEVLEYLIKKLSVSQLKDLLSYETEASVVNGEQLFNWYHPDLLEDCLRQIAKDDLEPDSSLSGQEQVTIVEEESTQSALGKPDIQQSTNKGLKRYGMYADNKHSSSMQGKDYSPPQRGY
ncbi:MULTISPECIES: Fic family protein [unclassified Legionella]|uniref:Fic family protein n=1 Tax=unclassified Legionella TaxID=2622702 RepID=UPI0010558A01|nr:MULTISPECIES: Fic family protein [unclassified Legionella]MDI9818739.1 Fic family protein [Legionella sp. PL877]